MESIVRKKVENYFNEISYNISYNMKYIIFMKTIPNQRNCDCLYYCLDLFFYQYFQ